MPDSEQKGRTIIRTIDLETPPRLAPGPTAYYWQRRAALSLLAGAVATVGIIGGSALSSTFGGVVVVVPLVLAIFLGIRSYRANVSSYRAIRREQGLGYTTLYGREYRRLWHLDPKTGAVIRRPGFDD